ncbi:gamma-glutamylcyclotransferase family protein [Rhodovibrio salinarum]|uniref:Gamma-glutamylcyclotransferase family protein n=1 Tax=Rhodovibrio salinarum TaxID=1087 RepID=A0A934QIJ3_9PROT|nr:gamma-glutamylcyclotransferase family protein [Rhodovibrio salinarum]MBK1697534.1 gamma-glutamylcyclotransferase [Rhodovibrio salinarum]
MTFRRLGSQADTPFAAVRLCAQALVYGTLKPGERNHRLIADAHHHGPAQTAPNFRLLNADIPAADHGGAARIEGELLTITSEQLARMDRLEGHPDWYRRECVPLADGTWAWLYLHPISPSAPAYRVIERGIARWTGGQRGARRPAGGRA